MSKVEDSKPLTLSNTLRDLALLRVSDIDTSALLPSQKHSTSAADLPADHPLNESVDSSYIFVKEARTALKIHNRADVGVQGGRVEDVRSQLDEFAAGVKLND
ncbi:hypothetical protein D9615_002401 [Tricholomella constricta]|uniref:Uncharacterized protein n=1 Tax=Tricholomella constricta TaxID=117010 RepID=A0A8H5M9T3_9AGAR|nr:hypothetical protein D9615_002401 [Tricholomella constricta]